MQPAGPPDWEALLEALPTPGEQSSVRDALGGLYQTHVPVQTRLHRGQYFTPDAVCDLMLAWGVQTGREMLLDAGCGTGAFLLRACEVLAETVNRPRAEILAQVHGIDLDPVAASIASGQLARLAKPEGCITVGDFLEPGHFSSQSFDLIVGNPPYVRAEHVRQAGTALSETAIQSLKAAFDPYLRQYPEQSKLFASKDLYLLFLIRATALLKPGGRLVYITSNSWLNTEFGKRFAHFIHAHYRVHLLMESTVERWFEDAAVNPVILAMERKQPLEEGADDTPVHWVRFNKPLENWMPVPDQPGYWQRVRTQLENLGSDPAVRVKRMTQSELLGDGPSRSLSFHGRASEDLSGLLDRSALWTPLDTWGKVRYPIKTGINRFFYLTRKQAEARGIEEKFLVPVIKSARQITHYQVGEQHTDQVLFSCPESKKTLREQGSQGALDYIEWGERQSAPPRQKRQAPVPWPEVPSVQGRAFWYHIPPLPPAHLLCTRFFDARFFFPLCEDEVVEDQTFYGLTLHDPADRFFVAALLNSTLSYTLLELHGRTSLGEGVLQFSRKDMAQLPVPNPALYSPSEKQALAEAFQAMSVRPVLRIDEEVLQADRAVLDHRVLAPLTGDPERWRSLLVNELMTRVSERRAMARSVKRK